MIDTKELKVLKVYSSFPFLNDAVTSHYDCIVSNYIGTPIKGHSSIKDSHLQSQLHRNMILYKTTPE